MKDVLEVIFVRVAGCSINGQPPAEEKLKSKTISLFLTLDCFIMYSLLTNTPEDIDATRFLRSRSVVSSHSMLGILTVSKHPAINA